MKPSTQVCIRLVDLAFTQAFGGSLRDPAPRLTVEPNQTRGMSCQRVHADDRLTRHYTWLGVAAASLVALGTVVFHWLEDEWSWIDSFYFSVVAVTTVGFGDFTPTTDASKLFAVFYILIGISLIAAALNGRLRRSERRVQARMEERQSRGRDSER